ncbi:MAG TPA: hypothetical protein VMU11_03610, partial [Verrucomicrobiae bacterium]|nr:hypothetical protein [Verrucomicrobiae bacterium]
LVGASLGDVKSGKKIITDALGGMLIILAAYLILNTINPATLNLSILNIQYVSRIDLDTVLETTRVDTTAVSLDDNADGGAAGVGGGSCPVHLATAATDPPGGEDNRSDEFKTAIAAAVTGGSSRDRVVHMADAAASCGVALGSCGHTAEEIYTLAGSAARGFQTHTIPQSIIVEMGQHKCQTYSRECNRPAMAQMFELTHGQVSGWPEAFTNDLQPGDVITVFNANSDGYGLHRAIFMGWAGSGRARVVQGSWGRLVSSGTICLTTACSNPEPIVRTFQPRP